jgi:hypothetical protein
MPTELLTKLAEREPRRNWRTAPATPDRARSEELPRRERGILLNARVAGLVVALDVALQARVRLPWRRRGNLRLVVSILLGHQSSLDRIHHDTDCEARRGDG